MVFTALAYLTGGSPSLPDNTIGVKKRSSDRRKYTPAERRKRKNEAEKRRKDGIERYMELLSKEVGSQTGDQPIQILEDGKLSIYESMRKSTINKFLPSSLPSANPTSNGQVGSSFRPCTGVRRPCTTDRVI
jgi:hypothetical protein